MSVERRNNAGITVLVQDNSGTIWDQQAMVVPRIGEMFVLQRGDGVEVRRSRVIDVIWWSYERSPGFDVQVIIEDLEDNSNKGADDR